MSASYNRGIKDASRDLQGFNKIELSMDDVNCRSSTCMAA